MLSLTYSLVASLASVFPAQMNFIVVLGVFAVDLLPLFISAANVIISGFSKPKMKQAKLMQKQRRSIMANLPA